MKQVAYQKLILLLLQEIYDERESRNIYKYVLEEYFGQQFIHLDQLILKDEELEDFNVIFEKITNHYPIQYIFQKAYFYNFDFFVNEHVLIPRPETEELVQLILQENDFSNKSILDIGTGSACIPITIKKHRNNWAVSAMDISFYALDVAKKNAKNHQTEIHFMHQDILNTEAKSFPKYDIIVSNPPYITPKEKNVMSNSTILYEPDLALFTPEDDALIFYKAIAKFAIENLNPNGKLYFELNEFYAEETKTLLQQYDFKDIRIIKDLSGKNRILSATI
ncbi:MAG: peptide chain release factor N(5)-glutamine methyltransferase [Bacteroidetes bacterium]|nr:peptide chain release factor N(5)-glutamine methyltransferase [Bacteroidota bacterium]